MTFDRHSDRVCACCARPAIGIGVAPSNAKSLSQVLWLCEDPECIAIGQRTMGMKQLEFSRLDTLAAQEAGAELEQYCQSIGKSDLRELTQAEWDAALRATIGAYRDALQNKLRNEAPF